MPTIFLAGIYGTGKSTLGEKISAQTGIPFYSAGDLISKVNGEKYGANKVVADKNKNQDILAECVADILRKTESILLAGHFCIVNRQGQVDKLPEDVFTKLQLKKIILLEANFQTVMTHLAGRDKKNYLPELIQELMKQEHQAAYDIAHRVGCPLVVHQMKYSDDDAAGLIPEL